jgi:hypothetical protein
MSDNQGRDPENRQTIDDWLKDMNSGDLMVAECSPERFAIVVVCHPSQCEGLMVAVKTHMMRGTGWLH